MACCHNVLGVILGFTVHWHCLGAGCTDNTEMVPPVPCGVTMLTNWPIIPIFHLSPSFSYLNWCKWHFTTFPNSCLEISYLKSRSVGHHPSFTYGGSSNSKSQEVREWCDGDGGPSSPHRHPKPLRHWLLLLLLIEIVETLHRDKHVINP